MEKTYVVDTSVIIEKAISKLIKKSDIKGKIIVHRAVVAELENQANKGQEIGMLGLEELQNLQELKKQGKIEIEFAGQRPNIYQIKYAKAGGEIDAMIREIAYNENAILVTADRIQAESARAFGVEVKFIELEVPKKKLEIEKFFDEKTMSVHLKEDCLPMGKKGKPGDWILTKLSDDRLSYQEIQTIAKEVVEKSRIDSKSFIEISRRGSTIIQYKNYRVVVVKPPVADGWEITAVRPLKTLTLDDYALPEAILKRIKEKARGIIVAGEVGSGKSTFSTAIAEHYSIQGKIVKTVESPRDLVLHDEITQYSKNFTTSEEIHDILFLSRPDNIIFDEMRDTPDFKLYVDLRLAGSNCLGVMHSATAIDAVQRFIGRLEAGMIPSVVDTIIFIEKGNIGRVLTLAMAVKVPTGMTEADLARPVIEVRDFQSNKLEYEIYSYGEETVVIPVEAEKTTPLKNLAAKQIENEFKRNNVDAVVDNITDNRVVVKVPYEEIGKIIGKQGKNIELMEKRLGIGIDIQELKQEQKNVNFEIREAGNFIVFYTNKEDRLIDTFLDNQFLFSATSSKRGEIRVHKKSKLGMALAKALNSDKRVELKTA